MLAQHSHDVVQMSAYAPVESMRVEHLRRRWRKAAGGGNETRAGPLLPNGPKKKAAVVSWCVADGMPHENAEKRRLRQVSHTDIQLACCGTLEATRNLAGHLQQVDRGDDDCGNSLTDGLHSLHLTHGLSPAHYWPARPNSLEDAANARAMVIVRCKPPDCSSISDASERAS